MRKESYLSQPQKVEAYAVGSETDVILRKDIEEVEKTEIHDDEESKYTVWECNEVQMRHKGELEKEKIEENFDYYFELADGKDEVDAIDKDADTKGEPSVKERIEALEKQQEITDSALQDLILSTMALEGGE